MITFMLTYGTETVGVDRGVMLTGNLIAAGVEVVAIGAFAALSDYVGRRPIYLAAAVFLGLFSFPMFWMVNTGSPAVIWLALSIATASLGAMYGPMGAFFCEMFDTKVRYTGASFGYQLASVFAGGLAPFISVALLARFGYVSVALYMIGMAVSTATATRPPAVAVVRGPRFGRRSGARLDLHLVRRDPEPSAAPPRALAGR